MEEFQQRVVTERINLVKLLEALDRFIATGSIFTSLPIAEQSRLRLQAIHMRAYSHILGQRIDAFKP